MRIHVSCLGAATPEPPVHNHRRHIDHRPIKWIGHHLLKRSPHNLQLVNALATAIGQALCHAVIGISLLGWVIDLAKFAIAQYVSREPKGNAKNTKDYFLAGKSLPWWTIGASLIAVNISA